MSSILPVRRSTKEELDDLKREMTRQTGQEPTFDDLVKAGMEELSEEVDELQRKIDRLERETDSSASNFLEL